MSAALEFMSPAWFEASGEALRACVAPQPVADVSVQFSCERTRQQWFEVIMDGQVAGWGSGEIDDADLCLEMDEQTLWGAATGEMDGAAVQGALSQVGGAPVSPMDLGSGSGTEPLPVIPGASLAVQYEYADGPWGDVPYALVFVDGQIGSMGLHRLADPDVTASCTYLQMAQVRAGSIGILDVLGAGGTVAGSEGPLALLGGFSESPEFRAVEMACGRSGSVLGALGQVHASAGFAVALGPVMARTTPPSSPS